MRKERECALTSNFRFSFGESTLRDSITASNKLGDYRQDRIAGGPQGYHSLLTKNWLNHQFSVPNKIQWPPFSFSKARHRLELLFKGNPRDQGKCPLNRGVPWMEVRLGFVNINQRWKLFLLFCVRICCSHYLKHINDFCGQSLFECYGVPWMEVKPEFRNQEKVSLYPE